MGRFVYCPGTIYKSSLVRKQICVFSVRGSSVLSVSILFCLIELVNDGFGPNPYFYALVCQVNTKIIGYSIYFYTYSTWEGRVVYIEDIYVQESYRGKGIGTAFIKHVAKVRNHAL